MAERHTQPLSQGAPRAPAGLKHGPLWLAIGAAAIFWVVESILGAALIGGTSLETALLAGEHPGAVWTRVTVVALILITGLLSDRLLSRLRRFETHTRKVNHLLRLLGAVKRELQHQPSERSLLETACHTLVQNGGFRCAWIAARNGVGLQLCAIDAVDRGWLKRVREEIEPRWAALCPLARHAYEKRMRKECEIKAGAPPPPHCPEIWCQGLLAMDASRALALPLSRGENTYGALVLHQGGSESFADETLAILEEVADDISAGLGDIEHRRAEERAYAALDLRVAELERFRKVSVDRELRIKELREEVKRLRARLAERGEGTE